MRFDLSILVYSKSSLGLSDHASMPMSCVSIVELVQRFLEEKYERSVLH